MKIAIRSSSSGIVQHCQHDRCPGQRSRSPARHVQVVIPPIGFRSGRVRLRRQLGAPGLKFYVGGSNMPLETFAMLTGTPLTRRHSASRYAEADRRDHVESLTPVPST